MTKPPILLAITLSACAGDAPAEHIVLTGNDVDVQSDRLVAPMATHPELAGLAAGDYVAGTQAGGYVRTIVDVTADGDRYTIRTAPSSLADAVGNASVTYRTTDDQDGNQFAIDAALERTRIYADDHVAVDLAAHVAFRPDVDLRVILQSGHLEQFIVDARGQLATDLSIDVMASAGADISADRTLWKTQHVFVTMIGWVPVIAVAELEVGAHVNANADGAITAHVDAGVDAQVSAGAEYALEQWRTFGDAVVERYISPISVTVQGNVAVSAYAFAELRVRLYDVAGPFVRVEPKLRVAGSLDGEWTRSIGVEGDAGADIALPMIDGAQKRFSGKVFDYSWPF